VNLPGTDVWINNVQSPPYLDRSGRKDHFVTTM